MLKDIGIEKLSKYHNYKNELNFLNNYVNKLLDEYGAIENIPATLQNKIKREKSRIERYARENSIHAISDEILYR